MEKEQDFLATLKVAPEDDTTWLVYADWLEEQGDPRSPFLRLAVALGRGAIDPERVPVLMERLEELRVNLDPGWIEQCTVLWASRPLRFRISELPLGNQEEQTSLVRGVLESGTIRASDGVAVPLTGDRTAHTWVLRLIDEGKYGSQFLLGQRPHELGLRLPLRPSEVPQAGTIVRSQEGDAELQRQLDLSLAELRLSIRATNCLESEGITTVRDLVIRIDDELLEVRNFGQTTLREVRSKLQERGLCTGMRVCPRRGGPWFVVPPLGGFRP